MNDDFLRRAWRRPPAAFEKNLRERLRQQELPPAPARRKTWLLIVSVLVGSSALAAVTYLTAKHFSSLASSASETRSTPAATTPLAQSDANQNAAGYTSHQGTAMPPAAWEDSSEAPLEEGGSPISGTRDSGPSPVGPSSSGTPVGVSNSATAPGAPTASVRIAIAPQLAPLTEGIPLPASYGVSAHADIASVDAALLALCTEASPRPDVVIASRRINQQELDTCKQTGAGTVMEAKLGHIVMVISRAKAGGSVKLSADTILRAVLKRVPSPQNPQQLIDNPYTDWNQIDRSLEAQRIEIFGPPRDSPEFLAFAATLLEPACDRYSWIQALQGKDRSAYEEICYTLRDDGVYKSAPWDSNFVRQRLWADPGIVAVIDYSFYSANSADLAGSLLTGPAPTSDSIMNGSYAGARPIYLYVRRDHHKRVLAVSIFVNDYLRRQSFTNHRWMTSSDGSTGSRRPYQALPLTEVRFDQQREQP